MLSFDVLCREFRNWDHDAVTTTTREDVAFYLECHLQRQGKLEPRVVFKGNAIDCFVKQVRRQQPPHDYWDSSWSSADHLADNYPDVVEEVCLASFRLDHYGVRETSGRVWMLGLTFTDLKFIMDVEERFVESRFHDGQWSVTRTPALH